MLPTTGMVTLPQVFASAELVQFLVLLVEGLLGGVLMVEDLDDLLTVDGFLDEGVHVAIHICCLTKVAAGAGERWRARPRNRIAANTSTKIVTGTDSHSMETRAASAEIAEEKHLREGLADGLAQGVGVVGVAAHDVAVFVGVEVADRQCLLVGEHVVADLLQRALFDGDDEPLP